MNDDNNNSNNNNVGNDMNNTPKSPNKEVDRLDRIEGKLDNLAEAFNKLARIEERMSHYHEGIARMGCRFDDHEERLRLMEEMTKRNAVVVSHVEKFGWLLISTAVGLWLWWVMGGNST
jgi:DNA repair ATPase RecN